MRKTIKYLLLVFLLLVGGFLIYQVVIGYVAKKEAETRIQTLPNVEFVSLTGDLVDLHSFDKTKPLVIIYFHPECEHCQYEAKEIGQNAKAFEHCQLVMITRDDSIQRVNDFISKYNLFEVDNIEILLDNKNQFKKTFGKALIPSVYIYDKSQKLKKQYLGETKQEAIISEIENEHLNSEL